MVWIARAPGKLVVLGEYAVLDGAPALVMAVNRYCRAVIDESLDSDCHLRIKQHRPEQFDFAVNEAAPVPLVELVRRATRRRDKLAAWRGSIDSAVFFDGRIKLGLGSSAAALCAWAGVWSGQFGNAGGPGTELGALVDLHRAFQNGAGSGLDVAACLTGGVIDFRLDGDNRPVISSVQLPNSVRFAGVFAGAPASTPRLVARYRDWANERPGDAASRRQRMGGIAEAGCEAAVANDARAFLKSVEEYGQCLDELGTAMQLDIVTARHREVLKIAERFGVVYKVSGAGGGDLGLAFSVEPEALDWFRGAIRERGFHIADFGLDRNGLKVEETSK